MRKRVQFSLDIPPAIHLQEPVIPPPLDIYPIPSIIPPHLEPPAYEDPAGVFSLALQQWPHCEAPVNAPSCIHLEILTKSIQDIKRVLFPRPSSKHLAMSGPSYQQFRHVFCFLKLQAAQEKQALFRPDIVLLCSRKMLAKQVAKGS